MKLSCLINAGIHTSEKTKIRSFNHNNEDKEAKVIVTLASLLGSDGFFRC